MSITPPHTAPGIVGIIRAKFGIDITMSARLTLPLPMRPVRIF